VADPDFELRGGPGLVLLALPTFVPSVISSFFTQNKGGGGGPPGPSPRSVTAFGGEHDLFAFSSLANKKRSEYKESILSCTIMPDKARQKDESTR